MECLLLKNYVLFIHRNIGDHGEAGSTADPLESQSHDQRSRRRPGWEAQFQGGKYTRTGYIYELVPTLLFPRRSVIGRLWSFERRGVGQVSPFDRWRLDSVFFKLSKMFSLF